ncbi:ring-opening amidohydrolase [Pseudomonas aeruginosa]|uniref:ring-opening amidohydrolase n=1 Tax=Pseudomonas aeruginosa TaxID=287 RepID=UPI0023E28A88|nr:ring-opening amidohydrolase [Pseudomonas aeruginosa]
MAGLRVKAEPSASGSIRGNRHVMSDDSDINGSRHARALVGGVLAGRLGDTRLFVSGGAEHQGPNGGGPLANRAHLDCEKPGSGLLEAVARLGQHRQADLAYFDLALFDM